MEALDLLKCVEFSYETPVLKIIEFLLSLDGDRFIIYNLPDSETWETFSLPHIFKQSKSSNNYYAHYDQIPHVLQHIVIQTLLPYIKKKKNSHNETFLYIISANELRVVRRKLRILSL